MKKTIAIINLFFSITVFAQNPVPALPQKEAILIMNGTAHIGNGEVIQNSVIGIKNGKIAVIADATRTKINKAEYPVVINATGKQVYPGFIDCNSNLGLAEIDLVRSTRDFNEVGDLNPNVRSIIAYNTDSKIPATVRTNGVLLAQIVPDGGTISGQSSVVELDGWNWEDAVYKMDDGIHMNWISMNTQSFNDDTGEPGKIDKNNNYIKQKNELVKFFQDAKAYHETNHDEKDLRFEAMRGLFDGTKTLFIHANYVNNGLQKNKFDDMSLN